MSVIDVQWSKREERKKKKKRKCRVNLTQTSDRNCRWSFHRWTIYRTNYIGLLSQSRDTYRFVRRYRHIRYNSRLSVFECAGEIGRSRDASSFNSSSLGRWWRCRWQCRPQEAAIREGRRPCQLHLELSRIWASSVFLRPSEGSDSPRVPRPYHVAGATNREPQVGRFQSTVYIVLCLALAEEASSEIVQVSASFEGSFRVTALAHWSQLRC